MSDKEQREILRSYHPAQRLWLLISMLAPDVGDLMAAEPAHDINVVNHLAREFGFRQAEPTENAHQYLWQFGDHIEKLLDKAKDSLQT